MIFKIINNFGDGVNLALDAIADDRYDDDDDDSTPELFLVAIDNGGLANLEGEIHEYPEVELTDSLKLKIIGVDII